MLTLEKNFEYRTSFVSVFTNVPNRLFGDTAKNFVARVLGKFVIHKECNIKELHSTALSLCQIDLEPVPADLHSLGQRRVYRRVIHAA